ncbi:MAG TPA: radical SAM protein [Anaerolineales bacterium]|nr:radical SAM protein [Anaerolineales bacterium]
MDAFDRLKLLSDMMELEPAEEHTSPHLSTPGGKRTAPDNRGVHASRGLPDSRKAEALCIYPAVMPNGKRLPMLKTLLTSACERNCYYCPFRAGRDFRRATFKPDEMAQTYMALHRAGIAHGLFLSSGVAAGGVHTQDLLIDTAEILRKKYAFGGYIHLKLMPGAEYDQVLRAMQLTDRVSINLEAPTPEQLVRLAPSKYFYSELFQPLRWVEQIRQTQPEHLAWKGRWPSSTTQFVVGAAGESDLELLATTSHLHQQAGLGRAYFSSFHPIQDTPLENLPAENPARELRLYQASFLLRDYGFELEELPFKADGHLPLDRDPKLAWAHQHLSQQPVEINRAGREELLRIPGIGPKSAKAILHARRVSSLCSLSDLKKIGVDPARATSFILLEGKRPPVQLALDL